MPSRPVMPRPTELGGAHNRPPIRPANYGSSHVLEGVGGNPVPNKRVILCEVQVDEPRDWVCSVFAEESGPSVLPSDQGHLVFIKVEWGSGGVQHSAEFEILRGQTFATHGSFVRVSARYEGTDPVRVLGSISPSSSGGQPALDVHYTGAIALGGGLEAISPPPFARRFKVIPNQTDAFGFQWRIEGGGFGLAFNNNEKMGWEPIASGLTFDIINDDPATDHSFVVIFEIGLS